MLVPTRGGTVARAISRFKPPVWIIAPSSDSAACQNLAFSYGVYPIDLAEEPDDWREWIARWLRENGITAERVMLVAGPSPRNPKANYRIELDAPGRAEWVNAERHFIRRKSNRRACFRPQRITNSPSR